MIFDKLAGISERLFPDLAPIIENAKLFYFPQVAHGTIAKDVSPESFDNFFLPFRVTAIEDLSSCIILIDVIENQTGIKCERWFIECMDLSTPSSMFADGIPGMDTEKYKGQYMVAQGEIREIGFITSGRYGIDGNTTKVNICTKNEIVLHNDSLPDGFLEHVSQFPVKNAVTAIEEIVHFSKPDSFILEESPAKKKKKKGKKIERSNQRSKYTILGANAIRDKMRLINVDAPKGKSPKPHDRRRHTRTLKSDFFKNAKGKVINVPATWVGPSESIVGKTRYKVRLDL